MGKGGKSTGKILFTALGFALGGFWTGISKFVFSNAVLGASLFGSIWSTTHKSSTGDLSSPDIQRFDKAQETMSSAATIPVVYGYRKITGNQTYHSTNADQNILRKHVVLCEGDIQGIESVSANDMLIPTNGQTSNTVFTIQNTMYSDAQCRKVGKHLYLYCNGHERDLYLANKDDASNVDTLWSWQTSVPELITYINKLGEGWEAFPTATTSKYPGDLWDFRGEKVYIDNVTKTSSQYPANTIDETDYYYELVRIIKKRTSIYGEATYRTTYTSEYKRYKKGTNVNVYLNPKPIQADTVTGNTWYTFYDCQAPSNYEETGAYPMMAWLDMQFAVSNELNGNPSVSCFIKGRKILDTRTNKVEYSTNPAMCLRDFILSKRYGLGKWINTSNIDEDSFKEAADYCDETITYTGSSGQTISCKRYELNIVIDQKQSALDWVTDILGNFCGFLVFSQDKLFLRIEKPESTAYKFNDSNCSDLSVALLSLDDTPNRYEVSFIDPLNNWNSIEAIVEDFADQKARQKIISKQVSLEGTTSQNQALRLARFYRDYNAICSKTVSFKTGQQALHLEPGDVIELTFHNVFKDEPFRITEIKENNDGTYEISARSYNKNIYNDYLGSTIQAYDYSTKPTSLSGVVPEIKDLQLSQDYYINGDGTIVSDINGSFILPDYDYFHRALIFYQIGDSLDWQYYGSTTGTEFTLNNAKTKQVYTFKIVVENTSGRKSEGFVTEPYYVSGKDDPPSDITNGRVWYDPKSTTIQLIWDAIEDKDLHHYEIQDENKEIIGTSLITNFKYFIEDNTEHLFYIYAVDNAGNKSVNPLILTAQREIACPMPVNFIATQDENNRSQINMSWDAVVDDRFKEYAIYVNDIKVTTTQLTEYKYIVSKSNKYKFSVVSVSVFNGESDKNIQELDIKIEPEDVNNFNMTQSDIDRSKLEFTWNEAKYATSYEIRIGSTWDSAKAIGKSTTTNFTYQISKEGYYTFWVKGIGNNNEYSVNATEFTQNIILTPNAVSNLSAKQDTSNKANVIITWDLPKQNDIAYYEIYVNNNLVGKSITNSYTYVTSNTEKLLIGVVVCTVAGFKSSQTLTNIYVALEPLSVTSFNVTQSVSRKSEIHLYWNPPENELDIAYYEIRMGDSWDNGTLVATHITNTYYDMIISVEQSYDFWLKVVSSSGHYSIGAAHCQATFNLNPSPVTNLVVEQDKNDKSIIDISWNGVDEFDISHYEIRIGDSWDNAKLLATTTNTNYSFKPNNNSGNVNIIVKSVNTSGFYSDEVSASLYAMYEPGNVEDFLVYQNGDFVEFEWAKVQENDVVGYEIREGYSWDNANIIVTGINTLRYEYKISFEGTFKYMIKAINRSGLYSVKDIMQTLKIENLSDKNIILELNELTDDKAIHDKTEFGHSMYNWQTLGGRFSDYPDTMFSESGGSSVLKLQKQSNGEYYSSGVYTPSVIDVKKEIIANVSCKFLSSARHSNGVVATLEFRTAKSDMVWTNWRTFTEAQYDFQYIAFRCILKTQDTLTTPEVNTIEVYIDVPDREEQGSLDVPVGGLIVNYKKEFNIIPVVTPYALGYGVRCEIKDKTLTGFTVQVLDEQGNDVGGHVNWRARGY